MGNLKRYTAVCEDKKFIHENWKLRVDWLLKNYGPIGERWDYNGGLFFFLNEKDKLLFVVANT